MECFKHPASSAVGICKACGKAVCKLCGIDTDIAIACSEVCAKEAADLHEMNQRGKKLYGIGVTKTKLPSGVIMWLLFAALFGGFGVFVSIRNQEPEWFLLLFGVISLFVAGITYRRAKDFGLQC